jgi:hypothetical protein
VWICPVTSWDGFLCNAGQFLVSIKPNSSDTSFTIESPALSLAEGNYLITGVSFRNSAVLSGFTLMYPRSGVVTIGGIATNIPLVNLAQADFSLAQPKPIIEPEPEPIAEPDIVPEGEPEPIVENESQTGTEPAAEPDTSPEGSSDSTESTSEETPAESEVTTESEATTEPAEPTETTIEEPETSDIPAAEASNDSIEDSPSESSDAEPTSEDPVTGAVEPDAEVDSEVTPSNNVEAEQTQPIVQTQPNVSPEVVSSQPAVVVPEVKPVVIEPEVVTPEVLPEPTPELFSEVVLPTMHQLDRRSALGGKVMQVTGKAKLVRKITAGSGSLRLLATNDSTVRILINQRVISELVLTKNQTITWFSRRAGKLKLQLSGDEPELLLDFLKVNGKLIKNPLFQMRS